MKTATKLRFSKFKYYSWNFDTFVFLVFRELPKFRRFPLNGLEYSLLKQSSLIIANTQNEIFFNWKARQLNDLTIKQIKQL